MQNLEAPPAPGGRRRLFDLFERQQALRFDVGIVMAALRAVGAILGTGPGLDGEQGAHLYPVGVMPGAQDLVGPVEQVVERQRVQLQHLFQLPVVSRGLNGIQ